MLYIQHSYHRLIHNSNSNSPFETCFGDLPLSPFDYIFGQHENSNETLVKEEKHVMKFIEKIQHFDLKVQEQLKASIKLQVEIQKSQE